MSSTESPSYSSSDDEAEAGGERAAAGAATVALDPSIAASLVQWTASRGAFAPPEAALLMLRSDCERGNVRRLACVEALTGAGRFAQLVATSDEYGENALMRACARGRIAAVRALLRSGAASLVGAVSERGFAPIHMAAEGGHSSVILALLRAGHQLAIELLNAGLERLLGLGQFLDLA